MVDDAEGTVEEIGLTYTFIAADDQTRLVIPNEKLASDTIVNFTIRDPEKIAEITVHVPLETDLDALLEELRAETNGDVYLSSLEEDKAVITLCDGPPSVVEAERAPGTCACAPTGDFAPPASTSEPAASRIGSARRPRAARSCGRGDCARERRKRGSRRRRRLGAVAVLAGVVARRSCSSPSALGGALAYQRGCSLASLSEIPIGENTFIYAADGSRLGSIPSERNRQPVKWSRISPWLPKATVAVEDKRFWQHGGIDPMGITRALWEDLRAGKVVQGGSTITQQLVRNLYISRERTLTRKLREACLAEKLANKWSKRKILTRVPEPRVLRQPGVRRRGGGADVLLEAREEPDAVAGRASRRSPAGAVAVRPGARSPRSPRAAQRGSSRHVHDRSDHAPPVQGRRAASQPRPEARHALQADLATGLLPVRARRAQARVRRGPRAPRRPARVHDDRSEAAARRAEGDRRHAQRAGRSRCSGRRDRSRRPARSAR